MALVLLSGGELSYRRLTDEFLLERRSAERYIKDLRAAGLPIASRRAGREAIFFLDQLRSKALDIEAIDIPPAAARSLSLLLVAAALLPAKLGVRDAVDRTVRAALRLMQADALRHLGVARLRGGDISAGRGGQRQGAGGLARTRAAEDEREVSHWSLPCGLAGRRGSARRTPPPASGPQKSSLRRGSGRHG